ncbi:penicillin-binding protein 2 [Mariprofundus erugo]|uniref:penicillin-binding protein 2 n=1 Tax=Mariprofundus erugo TaxID=2528639 RepID=UPI0010FE3110|nr:penicillin-binding protein 2 [Mariprofundus erugo]TLS77330.1 penicillin-binding protein 2 [Mariprofundus erugo]
MRNTLLEIRGRFDVRMLVLYAAVPVFLGALAMQMLKLQWYEHAHYALQAEQNRLNIVPVLPVRGEIMDVEGRGLAINRIAYYVQLIPERVANLEETLAALAEMLHWSDSKLEQLRKRIQVTRPDRPVLLDDKLQWEQVSPLAARLHHLPGVDVESGSYREYPYAGLTSHLIGYLSLVDKEDLDGRYFPSEFIGRAGVERSFEQELHGSPGSQQEEVDALGRRVAVLKRSPSVMGHKIRLALDIDVQKAAADALGDSTGAVVVMDVHTGAVIALLSQPGYDTNRFITGLESEQWKTWLNDPEKPLLNRASQAAYPPASTFKLVTGLTGLQHGSRLANGSTNCPGYVEFADRKLRCWKRSGHGMVSMHTAIVQSCDVYFYQLGDQLGMGAISDAAMEWGLGVKTEIQLSPESRGSVPTQSPYMMSAIKNSASKRMKWFRGETMITAIGQGALTATPLQIARLAAAIANGGKVLKPQLLADVPPEVLNQVDVSEEHLNIIRKAMRSVVEDPSGTAYRVLGDAPWDVAGKTGTAQVIKMAQDKKKALSQDLLQRQFRDHAWFMGYAPYKNPKVAIAVFIEHGGHGGAAAGPVAAEIIRVLAAKEQRARADGVQP